MKKISVLIFAVVLIGCSSSNLPLGKDKHKRYARQLEDKGLHVLAVKAYNELADKGNLNPHERAGVYYRAANICFENIRDYEKALSYYLKSELSGAKGQMKSTIQQRVVECLERLGKSYDAQKELDKRTLADKDKPLSGETVIALIGKRSVTMQELNEGIRMLPEYLQKEYKSSEKKLAFLQQYIATELLHDSAVRKGFDRSPQITKAAEQMKKNLMVEALLSDELASEISVTETEIKLYYKAHQDDYKGKTLDEVKKDVAMRLSNEKKQDAYRGLMQRLMQAEKVVIYDEYFVKTAESDKK